jgi:hypothetical protein
MRTSAFFFAVSAMSLFGYANAAAVYRCTDAKDMVQSQLTPCAPGEKEEIIGGDGKTAEQRIQAVRDAYNPYDWTPRIGMSKAEVQNAVDAAQVARYSGNTKRGSLDAWLGWGDVHVNRTTTARGVHEQWVFEGAGRNRRFLYIENDVVTGIQD